MPALELNAADWDDGIISIALPADPRFNRPATKVLLDIFEATEVYKQIFAKHEGEESGTALYEEWNEWLAQHGAPGVSCGLAQRIATEILSAARAIKKNMGWHVSDTPDSPDSTESTPEA